MKFKAAALTVLCVVVFYAQTQAHHSFSMFDKEKMITINGTLKEFEWTNPHCWLHVIETDSATGKNIEWSFEMGSITQVQSQGWKADIVKPGDKITISGHPLKDGSRGAQYRSAKLADGHSFQQVPDQNNNNTVR
jgi:hypothetical protein